jgi:hypothetical protein
LQAAVASAGFVHFEIAWRADVFSGAPQSSSAAAFGTVGINFRAQKQGVKETGSRLSIKS